MSWSCAISLIDACDKIELFCIPSLTIYLLFWRWLFWFRTFRQGEIAFLCESLFFITRFEFFHYRCILSCFRYTKDSNSFLKQSSYCFSVDLERSVVEAVFNRKIDVKMLRLMFSFFGQVMTFSFILECIIDTLLYTDCHFIISVKLDD